MNRFLRNNDGMGTIEIIIIIVILLGLAIILRGYIINFFNWVLGSI